MDTNETDQKTDDDTQAHDAARAEAQEPRGNPETEPDAVEKGKEQLDKVSGN